MSHDGVHAMRAGGAGLTEDPRVDRLLGEAVAVMERAYAPYSRFRVGAALLAKSGGLVGYYSSSNPAKEHFDWDRPYIRFPELLTYRDKPGGDDRGRARPAWTRSAGRSRSATGCSTRR